MDLEVGWNPGRVYTTATYQGDQSEDSLQATKEKFLDFLRSFRLDEVFTYRYDTRAQLISKGPTYSKPEYEELLC